VARHGLSAAAPTLDTVEAAYADYDCEIRTPGAKPYDLGQSAHRSVLQD